MKHDFDEIIERRGTDSTKWNSVPADVLPMWVADSDFRSPQPVIDALQERVRHGIFGYPIEDGTVEKATAHWMKTRFGWEVAPEWVFFTPGVVNALTLSVDIFTSSGENVLFLTPTYPPFFRVVRQGGRTPVGSAMLRAGDHYAIDFADLERKMADPKTRLFFLCNPQNPTGRVFTREELLKIGELCLKYGVLVFSDEIHCDYVFGASRHIPFSTLSPELAHISLTAVNPSKTFNIAGLQTSAMITTNSKFKARFKNVVDRLSLFASPLGSVSLKVAYTECAYYADQLLEYVRKNQEYAVAAINEQVPGVRAYLPESTCLLWLDFSGLCSERGLDQADLVKFCRETAKVAMNSGTDFGQEGEGFMRMNVACPLSTVKEGVERIRKAVAG